MLFVRSCYEKMHNKLAISKSFLNRPFTLAEKILFSHLSFPEKFQKEEMFLKLSPDRVLMQDVTAQMALLQFMLTGKDSVDVPTTIHCDHLITAKEGVDQDVKVLWFPIKKFLIFFIFCFQPLQHWLLETRCGYHSSGCFGKLCFSWCSFYRYRFSHSQRWRAWDFGYRSGWSRCSGCYGGLPLGVKAS